MEADTKRLYQDVKALSAIYPYRNYKNVASLKKAAAYIKTEFSKSNLHISTQEWEARGNTYENIIATFQPKKKKRMVIGAHYDVYKDQPGADDNASSVAGLLELTRLLKENNLKTDYRIDFVAFCLEEPPFFRKKEMGSYIHAKSIGKDSPNIIGMIALEMIGYYQGKQEQKEGRLNKNYLMVTGIKKYDRFNKKISQLLKVNKSIDSRRLSFADNYRNNGPSDHRNYWPFDIPAVMVIGTGGAGNPNYHRKTDTIDTLDFKVMTVAVNSIAHAVFNYL